jgi:hypothetical protein
MGSIAATAFGLARALTVDPTLLGDHPATVEIQVPDLATYHNIPLVQHRWVNVTANTHEPCSADAKSLPKLHELGVGVLTVKEYKQTVRLPAGAELAVFLESMEQGGGNSVSCTAALRFHSEPDKHYLIQYESPKRWHLVACRLTIVELAEGKELAVASAHEAALVRLGGLKGSDLNVCAERVGPDISAEPPTPSKEGDPGSDTGGSLQSAEPKDAEPLVTEHR